ncbi:MAG: alpha-ketoglutarate-dependent dioxygenase AlkB [Rhodobiaceae bacterium]|nr:alpha-ketoglutarate-dependent dioxygenase AlkB [Rhodobiaceae bacterium]
MTAPIAKGVQFVPGFLDRKAQETLRDALRDIATEAPFYTPAMPRTGKPFSVKMTNCGPLGWVSDREGGYRYQATHPKTGRPWPPIPDMLMEAWETLSQYDAAPEACLINFYRAGTRMGLHQDSDEEDFAAPVVSLSLGDTGVFRIGGRDRKDPTRSVRLSSGDAIVLAGPARLAYHGIDRIIPDTSSLLKDGGRINVTLRRVTRP